MPKPLRLGDASTTELSLWGRRAAERFDEAGLAAIGELANLERCVLSRQLVSRLPPSLTARTTLQSLSLYDMPLDSLDGIANLTSLRTLTLHELPQLDPERAFAQLGELPELAELTLGGDTFVRMPASVARLHSLLDVTLNDTPKLDFTDAFRKLGKLEFLRALSFIQRSRMALPDAFAPLTQVRSLQFLFYFVTMPPSVGAMVSLEKLELERNRFKALPATFGKLTKLKELLVNGSKLTTLPDELCNCTALEVLDLSGNPLKTLPARIGDLVKLKRLDVMFTKLKALPASVGALQNLRTLRVPDLDTLPEAVFALALEEFDGPRELKARFTLREVETPDEDELYLDNPERLPADLGQPLELRLRMSELGASMPQLAKLRKLQRLELELGPDDLDLVLPHLTNASRLEQVSIEGDYATLPASLGALAAVKRLYIKAPLTSLPRELGRLAQLTALHLYEVKLAAWPDAITELAALELLELDAPALEALPKSVGTLASLGQLVLHNLARVRALPAELAQCAALERVTIDFAWGGERDALGNLEVLGKLPRLTELSLGHMNKLDLASLFEALAKTPIAKLDLSHCELKTLPKQIGLLGTLAHLDLVRTRLTQLPPELAACTALRSVELSTYELDRETRDRMKELLPKGGWKKTDRRGTLCYTRSD